MLALIAKHHATRVTTFPPIDRSDNYFFLHAKFQSAKTLVKVGYEKWNFR